MNGPPAAPPSTPLSKEAQVRMLQEKESEIAQLRLRCSSLSHQLQHTLQTASAEKQQRGNNNKQGGGGKRGIPLSPHAINVREIQRGGSGGSGGNSNYSNKRTIIHAERKPIGRNASLATRQVLDSIVTSNNQQQQQQFLNNNNTTATTNNNNNLQHSSYPAIIQRILDMFQHPTLHMDYLNSDVFAKDLLKLSKSMKHILEKEPRVVYVQSPCYVFGDIHGNLEDLHFFSDNIWRLGMSLTAGNFLFLGDYVDRGLNCLETVAYLFAMKHELPNKVFLLRGNHETRDVNGWEEHYADRSFIWQCRSRFGDDLGYRIWESCNAAFDRLPLAAVIDQDIFCVHGGIPRPISDTTTRIQDILTVPKVAGINPPYEHEDDQYQQVASDCIWSDPASEEQEMTSVDPTTGYGESLRGGGAICFGNKAVTDFLQQQDFSYIMRAHEAHADGVAISKGARVFTVFSTSKDHNQGNNAMAGCMLVDNAQLQVINRSPAYKNQYVHRRDSVSLASLPESEIQKRMKLGLVTNSPTEQYVNDVDEELEDWEDFDDEDEDDGGGKEGEESDSEGSYTFGSSRRSSVDMDSMSANLHDSNLLEDSNSSLQGANIEGLFEPNKRLRSRKPMCESISEELGVEEEDDEEIDTVNGDDDDDDVEDMDAAGP